MLNVSKCLAALASLSNLREGQPRLVKAVIERVAAGEHFTALVAPPRFGKSNVIRSIVAVLHQSGWPLFALALSPTEFLRDQLSQLKGWQEFCDLTGYSGPDLSRYTLAHCGPPGPNGETFTSATIHVVNNNADIFVQWVEFCVAKGSNVLIFVDEGHMSSVENSWGDTCVRLARAGAYIVLLTATPYRDDNRPIPGFDIEEESRPHRRTVLSTEPASSPDYIVVEDQECQRVKVKLKAHGTVTPAEAYEGGYLCTISALWLDVDFTNYSDDEFAGETGKLSEQSNSKARRLLSRLVRQPAFIRQGCERLLTELSSLRLIQRQDQDGRRLPDYAGIVFCGNDDDAEANKHAKQIRDVIKEISPGTQCVIATTADGDDGEGKKNLEAFVAGAGDVLIVKMMASQGIDSPRIKVGLDLSTVRTEASFVQRVHRPATVDGSKKVCVWISPQDPEAMKLFAESITANGGAAREYDRDIETIRTREVPRKESDELVFEVNRIGIGVLTDTDQNHAGAENLGVIDALRARLPELARYTHAELALRLVDLPGLSGQPAARGRVVLSPDGGTTAKDLRFKCNDIATRLASRLSKSSHVPMYPDAIQAVWKDAFRRSEFPVKSIRDYDVIAPLERLLTTLEKMERARS